MAVLIRVETRLNWVCKEIGVYRTPWLLSYLCNSAGIASELMMKSDGVRHRFVHYFKPSPSLRSQPRRKFMYVQIRNSYYLMLEWEVVYTHTYLTLKLANLIWNTCGNLFIQTDLTFNVSIVICQQSLSLCLSTNITHDIHVSTCVLAILTVDFAHIGYVRHMLPHFRKLFLQLVSTGRACVFAFSGMKLNRMFVVRMLQSFTMQCSLFLYVWYFSYVSTSGPFQNCFLISVISSVGPSYTCPVSGVRLASTHSDKRYWHILTWQAMYL